MWGESEMAVRAEPDEAVMRGQESADPISKSGRPSGGMKSVMWAPGRGIVECFKPFLRHLLSLDLSRKTLHAHRDNLWLLGGELIRDLHETPRLRKQPIAELVLAAFDEEGGPLIDHGASEDQQRAFDATCRKLYRFLKGSNSSCR